MLQCRFWEIISYFCPSKGIDSVEQRVVGGEVTMTCPIQTPNDTEIGEWSWYRYDSAIRQKRAVMEANNSVIAPNVTSLNQPKITGPTYRDFTLILQGLQLNDSGVYECQLNKENHTELRYIKLVVNGKLMKTTNITGLCGIWQEMILIFPKE